MAQTSETGHAKNVANFAQLVAICTSYGAIYQPSNPAIQLQGLGGVSAQAKECLTSVNSAQAILSNALSTREVLFSPFSKLVTRIGNAVKASGVSKQTKDQVAAIIRKLQGRRATPKMTDEEKQAAMAAGQEIVEVSSSQMSIDNQLENFDKLIKLLASIPEYAPNESELTFDGIRRNQPPIQAGRSPEIYQIQVTKYLRLPVL
ncbi:MAG: hypothetical protein Q8P34_05200 [Bacteroidota bacterium]|nr:hypothetical protein [Bacteroidota bacterium]